MGQLIFLLQALEPVEPLPGCICLKPRKESLKAVAVEPITSPVISGGTPGSS